VTLGSIEMENNMAFRGAADAVADIAQKTPAIAVEVVAGADHFYTGVRPELAGRIERFLAHRHTASGG
jgi:alpha/beta superfamily hydrolase